MRGTAAVRVRRGSWNVRVHDPRARPARRRLDGGARRGKPLANLLPLSPADVGGRSATRGRTNSPLGNAACPFTALLALPGAARVQRSARWRRLGLCGSSTPASPSQSDGWMVLPWEK